MAAFTEEEMKGFSMQSWYGLDGEVAIVTGGASGLGLAIVRCLVSAGAEVAVVASRSPEAAAETLAEFGRRYVTISMTSQIRSMLKHWWSRS